MPTIFERTSTALGTINPAISFALAPYKNDLPSNYTVYQLIDGDPVQHADDQEKERAYIMQVTMWSTEDIPNPSSVDTAMTTAGFIKGRERQLPQDVESGHYGLAIEYSYLETKE